VSIIEREKGKDSEKSNRAGGARKLRSEEAETTQGFSHLK